MSAAARVVVIGAGPIGLEAALGARERGHAVTVLEKDRVGANLDAWGARTRFFSPFGMNVSPRARRVLGPSAPSDDALLTGPEMAQRVLVPLARALDGAVHEGHAVRGVARARLTRRDLPGHPLRAERPFLLLVDTPRGEEAMEADVVLDASGVYGRPAALGSGGLPAPGEGALDGAAVRRLGELDSRLDTLAGRDVLLVGHGHSAAGALAMLSALSAPARVVWATRSPNRRPCTEVAGDPLPERARVAAGANDLAAQPPPWLTVERRVHVASLAREDGRVRARLSNGREVRADVVVGLTGYRPDLSFLSELALEVAPATEGPAPLARALLSVADCLARPHVTARDLASGEPGFHVLGAKSYGRLPTFLLRAGLEHVEAVLDGIPA